MKPQAEDGWGEKNNVTFLRDYMEALAEDVYVCLHQ